MKISILGGGPAGLYFALLMKRLDPDNEVTLVERNPADATYGWGVVFSDRTLGSFREADLKSFQDMADNLTTWDAIDIKYGGETIRCEGQGFSGLGRKKLLRILQDHCSDVGVDMEFENDVTDLERFVDSDLVVAADGVNSLTRRIHETSFLPRVAQGRSKFVWFGTTAPFDCFTFIFRTNEHGLFQVHAYPFDGNTSTFIVECTEEVWRRAGLDGATEDESLAYCENLFSNELRGHSLMSNRSLWMSFPTVKNEVWHHENVVLVGDAAHTAHFSIGSGTKLAMEDSIALAYAFSRHKDVQTALGEYESARKLPVGKFQHAARQSQRYFENTARYMHLEPLQFAFHLLSRSGRMNYTDLRLRDQSFVSRMDSWFASQASRRGHAVALAPPPAFVPLAAGRLEVSNRVMVAAPPTYTAIEGLPGEDQLASLSRAASTGAGLVMTEMVAVSAEGRVAPGSVGIFTDEQTGAWGEILRNVKDATRAKICLCLSHAGRRAATEPRFHAVDQPLELDPWEVMSASAVRYGRRMQVPREMADADLKRVIAQFAGAAGRGLAAGFDLVKVDMSRGYLLASFLSPKSNHRVDRYGGDLQSRARFPIAVFEAVRAVWPDDRPIAVSLTATDWERGGWRLADAIWVARELRDRGCDVVEVTAGQASAASRSYYDPYMLTSYSDRIRNEAGVATAATGPIMSVDEINTIVAGGRADLCLLTRKPV